MSKYLDIATYKEDSWAYEREWRFISTLKNHVNLVEGNIKKNIFRSKI